MTSESTLTQVARAGGTVSNVSVRAIQRKAFWYPVIGSVWMAACAVTFVTSAAKALFLLSRSRANALDDVFVGRFFGGLIAYAYQSAAEWAPLTVEFVWGFAPRWTSGSWYPGNAVLGVYLLVFAGMYLRNRGREYKSLLAEFRRGMLLRRMEENELGVRVAHDRTAPVAAAELPTLPWHQGVTGTIGVGITIGLAIEVLKIFFGLAKLP